MGTAAVCGRVQCIIVRYVAGICKIRTDRARADGYEASGGESEPGEDAVPDADVT